MRNLKRNQQKLYYSLYKGKVPIIDDDGYETGDYEAGYDIPVSFYANISAARGSSDADMFGINLSYEKTICTCDMDLPITDGTLIWNSRPELKSDGTVDAELSDYVVVKKAKSINSISYAVKQRQKNMGFTNG